MHLPISLWFLNYNSVYCQFREHTANAGMTITPIGSAVIGGRCLSPPARIALAGKALRVRLDAYHLEKKALPVVRLAPFYTSLARPQVVSEAGSPLAFVPPPTPYGVGGLIDLASLIAQSVVRDPEGVDVVFRWQVEEAALVARLEGRTERDEAGIAREDQALANFFMNKLQRWGTESLFKNLLEAYGQVDALGVIPGSAAVDVVAADTRMEILGDSHLSGLEDDVAFAREEFLAFKEWNDPDWQEYLAQCDDYRGQVGAGIKAHRAKCEEAQRRVRARLGLGCNELAGPGLLPTEAEAVRLFFPSSEGLIAEWRQGLVAQSLSEPVIRRKVRHLEKLARYLENREGGEVHILLADERVLNTFFFWEYIRWWGASPSGTRAIILDVRDFYRFQEQRGRIKDSRFAELFHGLREMIVDRVAFFGTLNPFEDAFWDELYEKLFL